MSAAAKRIRAHFSHYRGERGFIRSITTGKGEFPLLVEDIKYLAGERQRSCRELRKRLDEFVAETDSSAVDVEWLRRWIDEVGKR